VESINYPSPLADPEAGEEEHEEVENWKNGEFEENDLDAQEDDLDAQEDEDWEEMIRSGKMKSINPDESMNESKKKDSKLKSAGVEGYNKPKRK